MGIEVDWDERRKFVATVAEELIAQFGMTGVTVRSVAERAGFSTAVVSHYFENKDELLFFTYTEVAARAATSVAEYGESGDFAAALEQFLPLDEKRLRQWKIWISFWAKAATDDKFRQEQVRWSRQARAVIRMLLERTLARGGIGAEADIEQESRRLVSIVVGISTQHLFDPEAWPTQTQRALLRDEVAKIPGWSAPA